VLAATTTEHPPNGKFISKVTNMPKLFLSIVLLLAACTNNTASNGKNKVDDALAKDSGLTKDRQKAFSQDTTSLNTGWYYIVDTANGFKRQLDKSTEAFFIDPTPIVTAKNLTTLEIHESNVNGNTHLLLIMRLDKNGTENWIAATGNSVGKQLAFILDDKLLRVPKVNSQITAGVTALNRGDYSRQELEKFKAIIETEK
jgi:preprotein translocase subunit SecD